MIVTTGKSYRFIVRAMSIAVIMALMFASDGWAQKKRPTKRTAPAKRGNPHLDDIRRSLSQLDSELVSGNDSINEEINSLKAAMLLKKISKLPPEGSDIETITKVATTIRTLGKMRESYLNEEYLKALSTLIKLGISQYGGPPAKLGVTIEDILERIG